ncbi:MAG: sulfite exporter TauE/SafE family protein [Nevskia sp.]|nr:sulfite exporter TauE/SafE family protein [Nevskia sp.]
MSGLAIALGAATGIVLGLTGAGGSVIAVPLLMAGFGWSLPQAAPVALIAVAASAAFGAYGAWRRGIVRYRAASLMGLAGIVVSPAGLCASRHLPVAVLSLLFAGVMALVAVRMLRQSLRLPAEAQVVRAALGSDAETADRHWCRLNPETGRLVWSPATWLLISAVGIGTGFLSGLLGVGGGFVIVPSLRALTPLSMQSAVATSLMTIAIIATGTVGWSALGSAALPWAAAPFAGGAVGGMLLARRVAARMAGAHLEQGFAALLLVVAAGLAAHALKLV